MLEAIFYIDRTINRASYSVMLLRIILLDFSQLGCISSMSASLLIQTLPCCSVLFIVKVCYV